MDSLENDLCRNGYGEETARIENASKIHRAVQSYFDDPTQVAYGIVALMWVALFVATFAF